MAESSTLERPADSAVGRSIAPARSSPPCWASLGPPAGWWPFRPTGPALQVVLAGERLDDALCQRLLRVVQLEFFRDRRRPLTSRLRDAVLAAHFFLRQENASQLPGQRVQVALACGVLGRRAFNVALAGAGAAGVVGPSDRAVFATPDVDLPGASGGAYPVGGLTPPFIHYWAAPAAEDGLLVLVAGSGLSAEQLAEPADARGRPPADPEALADRLAARLADRPGHSNATSVALGPGSPPGTGARWGARTPPLRPSALLVQSAALARTASARPAGARAGPATRPRWALPLVAALAVLVIVALALGRPPGEPEEVAWAREAETLLEQASQTRERDQARRLLDRAALLAERIGQQTSDPAYSQLRSRVRAALDELDRVYRVRAVPVVALAPGQAAAGGDLAPFGGNLFVQDLQAEAIRRFPLAAGHPVPPPGRHGDPAAAGGPPALEAGPVVLRAGTEVGGAPVGAPVALARVPPGGRRAAPALLALDAGRTLLVLGPEGATGRIAPAGRDQWVQVGGLGGHDGALYVLDPARRAVLRYPAAPALDEPPLAIVDARAAPDLDRVLDFAVGRDGVYLLFPEGVVRRFSHDGTQRPFAAAAPDRPVGAFSAIAAGAGPDSLYLADPANQRILHVTASGAFIRQLRVEPDPNQLAGVRRLALDEGDHRLVALTERAILTLDLPAEIPVPLGPSPADEPTRIPK